jgi:pyrophosphate--fructose-6-phosphate 1-phosphotransferase
METHKSPLQIARSGYQPKIPLILKGNVALKYGEPTESVADQKEIKSLFPKTYGLPVITFEEGVEDTISGNFCWSYIVGRTSSRGAQCNCGAF